MLATIFGSWNVNRYHTLKDVAFPRLCGIVAVAAAASVVVFWLLLLPAIFQLDQSLVELGKTTTITLDATVEQTAPAYLAKNPDIVITPTTADGWIVLTPSAITIQKYFFFGEQTYLWKQFATVNTAPVQELAVPLTLFLLPSLLFWSLVYVALGTVVLVFLFTLGAFAYLRARSLSLGVTDLAKVAVYATVPSLMVLGALPILRLGLPVTIILGVVILLWLGYSIIGTVLLSVKHAPKTPKVK